MNSGRTTREPSIQRYRPTDATGLFWAFVLVVAAAFCGMASLVVAPVVLLVAAPIPVVWQFWKWHADAVINRQATAWCRRNYPACGDWPVVDFVVALVHCTGRDLGELLPTTPLDELNGMTEEDDDEICYGTGCSNRHQVWLGWVASDAKLRNLAVSQFHGTTLDDAVRFVTAMPAPV